MKADRYATKSVTIFTYASLMNLSDCRKSVDANDASSYLDIASMHQTANSIY